MGVGLDGGGEGRLLVVEREAAALAFAGKMGDGLVDGNLVQPGRQPGVAAEVLYRLPGFHECILKQIVGIGVRLHHAAYLAVQRLGIHGYDLGKSLAHCRGVAQAGYQCGVFSGYLGHRWDSDWWGMWAKIRILSRKSIGRGAIFNIFLDSHRPILAIFVR